jgi:hypothetical protein
VGSEWNLNKIGGFLKELDVIYYFLIIPTKD